MTVRNERVILSLQDEFSTPMARAAAATALANRELKSLSGSAVRTSSSTREIERGMDRVAKSANRADNTINQLTGRLRLFADVAAILGPTLVPTGGVLVAGMAGLAQQMGFAAVAGGVLIGSVQGVGDALKALNEAQLEPSADNLRAVEDALNALSPAAADFVREAADLEPTLRAIRDMGAEGLFPGVTASLDDLERLAPVVGNIFSRVGEALGQIASDGAASLASDRWRDFFDFIATEAPRALTEMAATVGDLTHGLAELWMAFAPLNSDFSSWLMDVASGFDEWATGLSATEGFREFVDYIRTTGPQVAETAGALANAVVQIVQAAAPLGGPTLAAIEGFAEAIGTIADSNLGTPILAAVAALAAYNRALSLTAATQRRIDAGGGLFGMVGARQGAVRSSFAAVRNDVEALGATWATAGARTSREQARMAESAKSLRSNLGSLTKQTALAGAPLAGLAVASTGAADDLGLTNTASLTLMGTLAGPFGAAIGGGAGLLLDMKAAADSASESVAGLYSAIETQNIEQLALEVEALRKAADAGPEGGLINFLTGAGDEQYARQLLALKNGEEALADLKNARSDAAADMSFRDMLEAESAALEKNIGLMQAKRDQALRSFSAETSYAAALMDSKKAIEENGRAWNLNTEAGLDNRRALESQASAWNELNRNTEQSPAAYRKARSALMETAEQMGASRAEARKYANQLLDIPSDLKTKIALDVDTAVQRAKAIKAELASIDRNIDVYVNVRRPNAGGFGPQVTSNAVGDFKNKHSAEIAPGGAWRVWAEPETGGESYIPHANDHRRPRAKKILEQTADIFGGQIQWFADGGTTGNAKKKPRPTLTMVDNTGQLERQLERLNLTLERQTSATDRLREVTDGWAQKMSDVARGTTSGFNSGLFDMSSDPWAADSGGGAIFNLTKDIKGLTVRGDLQAQLADAGLNGDALAALLNEGSNADIQNLIATGQVSQYAALFNQRAALQGSVGRAAGMAAYGSEFSAWSKQLEMATREQQATAQAAQAMQRQLDAATKLLERLDRDLPERTGAAVRQNVDKVADKGHRGRK